MIDIPAGLGLLRSIAVYHGQPWRSRALRQFTRMLVAPGDLAFDIGAHVGNRTRALEKAGARVIALEPQPLFADFLERFVASDNIVVLRRAVGEAAGIARLRISRRHPTVSSVSADWVDRIGNAAGFREVSWDSAVDVPMTTLDELIATHGAPHFVKIDVEGNEAAILRGLSVPLRLLAFEYLPATLEIAFACIDRLEMLAPYRYNLVVGENHRFQSDEWMDANVFRRNLTDIARSGRSGDVYACLSSHEFEALA